MKNLSTSLIGSAGVHYVCAVLNMNDLIALPTVRNIGGRSLRGLLARIISNGTGITTIMYLLDIMTRNLKRLWSFLKMESIPQYTKTGTVLFEGIEYNDFPPPQFLLRAMERCYATKLRNRGILRLSLIDYYRELEKQEIGDRCEGKGLLTLGGHPIETSSINEVFVWCGSLPDTDHTVLISLAEEYDTVVQIRDPAKFAQKVLAALLQKSGLRFHAHLGAVNYNRGASVSEIELKDQKWQYNVFQKDPCFCHHREYRMVFTNVSFDRVITPKRDKYIDLDLGPCLDLVAIEGDGPKSRICFIYRFFFTILRFFKKMLGRLKRKGLNGTG